MYINGNLTLAYIDLGSSCTTIRLEDVQKFNLQRDETNRTVLQGFGNACTSTLGTVTFDITVDEIQEQISAHVVPNSVQEEPILLGRNFTELPNILVIKDNVKLTFHKRSDNLEITRIEPETKTHKLILKVLENPTILPEHWGHVKVYTDDYEGDVFIESSIRSCEGQEYCIPRTIISMKTGRASVLPVINLSDNAITFSKDKILARGIKCEEDTQQPEKILNLKESRMNLLPIEDINIGSVPQEAKKRLIKLLNDYRDCFALTTAELGCSQSTTMKIHLHEDKPFCYRPYRMSKTEQDTVKEIVDELLEKDIVRESESEYSSPVLLVRKKNGEQRLCIDYRKLNSLTVKENQPLPRIDDQIDKLQSGNYFTSLDLKSGYYQVPLEESSKRFTAFVTPEGHYEFNRVPFGLTNAPRVFQRLMIKIMKPIRNNVALYLDDVLLYNQTIDEAVNNLKDTFEILRQEGLTLNLKKCAFLQTSVSYLGFEIQQGTVKPGADKIRAVKDFPTPTNVHNIRQFLGLTGYFRHFVEKYALIAKPLTTLTKKNYPLAMDRKRARIIYHITDRTH